MALILTQKRTQLLEFLANDPALRAFLRRRWQSQLDLGSLDELRAESFDDAVAASHDPDRLVARALMHAELDVALCASTWAEDVTRIPPPRELDSPSVETVESGSHRLRNRPADERPADGPVVTDADSRVTHGLEPDNVAPGAPELSAAELHEHVAAERAARLVAEEKLAHVATELDSARASIRRLEAVNLDLRARVPTGREKRRANKELGELRRAARELVATTEEINELRAERDKLLESLRRAETDLEEAIEARQVAERSRRGLEGRLATVTGRAEYLRRSIDAEIDEVAALHAKSTAKERTRARRRVEDLEALRELLDRVFPSGVEAVSTQPSTAAVVVRDDREIRVIPIGGGDEIGGSSLLVSLGDRRILIDAGMRPDGGGPRYLERLDAEQRIDAVIITHAHNDHAGYVPALLQRFPTPVIASPATAQLLPTMWSDSARVMRRTFEEAAEWTEVRAPLYGEAEIEEAEQRICEVPSHRARRIGDVEFTLFPAGHILGAAGVVLSAGGRRIVVTGDITAPNEEHLAVQPTHLPTGLVRDADLLVIESTYCHGNHADRQHEVASLVDAVKRVVERRGRVLIPAFGLGRAQEVAMILANELPEVEVLVDGLAKTVSDIYETISARGSSPLKIFTGRVRPVENRFREMKSFRAGVIVSTSGMLNGGPAVEWAKAILPDENDALLLCGYQDEYAPGRKLENLARQGGSRGLELPDLEDGTVLVPVRAHVQRYRLSAHADRRGLLDIVAEVNPAQIMLVHGEPSHQEAFRHELRRAHRNAVPTGEHEL